MLLRVNFFHCFRGRVACYPQPPIPETSLEQLNFPPSIQKEKQDFEAVQISLGFRKTFDYIIPFLD